MNEDINELLSYYKNQKAFFESLIEQDTNDGDYNSVVLNTKVLGNIKHKINIIESLLDPFAKEKDRLKNIINFYVEKSYLEESDEKRNHILVQIDHKLDQLNSYRTGYFNDGQEFDDVIFDLVENKISAFIFNLRKEKNLHLRFSIKKNKIIIRLTPFAAILDRDCFTKNVITVLKQIGFKKNKLRTCFQIKYPLDDFKDAIPIKAIVSQVIYEAFYNYQINKSTTIEITS
ncbi:hypothetical protein [Pedobacter soli]|uniref:Uncharacterized protein n=1 Tax=Pedobacter soli TaxID=390242 RepID=A0A1G6TTV0_9SPHI|nr:hypothetical protein [Pedobacter soli]SDD32344.1 hypothetical protein SAMN04488024_105120 [Pedobacter soli]